MTYYILKTVDKPFDSIIVDVTGRQKGVASASRSRS